jgi:hypothetical protein
MEEEALIKFREQHVNNYKKAILENIKNNTCVLVDDDIMSIIRKPPLDSMDLIKSKFLDLARKNKIVLNTEELSIVLEDYRNDISKCCDTIKNIRIEELSNKVEKIKFEKNSDIIKINKKDFTNLNKEIKKVMKNQLDNSLENVILNKIDEIFLDGTSDEVKGKITNDISKYLKGTYQKQLLENFDIKILVKDTTLMNGTKEQSERYLFTLNNSRLLNDNLNE